MHSLSYCPRGIGVFVVLILSSPVIRPTQLAAAPNIVYAGTNAGVFKSINGGATWTAVNSGLTNLAVTSLAVDPTNPFTVYAGGAGVFRSTNGGATWVPINNGLVLGFASVTEIVIDPKNPATIYAATGMFGDGVFKTTNGGASWTAANNGLITAGSLDVRSMVIDPINPNVLYLTGVTGLTSSKTVDGAANWTPIDGPGFGFALAIDPSDPTTVYGGGPFSALVKTTDAGETWESSNTGITDFFINHIAIDPSTTNTLYVGTSSGDLPGGVFKSVNGGSSWAPSGTGLTGNQDVSALAIDPSDTRTIYAGTADAIFRTIDGALNWNLANSGIPASVGATALAIAPPCGVDLKLTYSAGTLTMSFSLGVVGPATWNVWLSLGNGVFRLWNISLPTIPAPIPVSVPIPFPSVGSVGVLTTITTSPEGVRCSDWATVETGRATAGAGPSIDHLQGLADQVRRQIGRP